jgi:hypothetical protein
MSKDLSHSNTDRGVRREAQDTPKSIANGSVWDLQSRECAEDTHASGDMLQAEGRVGIGFDSSMKLLHRDS